MRFQVEPFAAWHDEAKPLFYAHWRLVGRHKDAHPLAIDYARWIEAERNGMVFAATARIGWELAGYAWFMVARHWDYPSIVEAKQRAIYIEPRHLAGLRIIRFKRFLEFCERELKSRGANKIVHHLKYTHDFSALLAKLGYEDSEKSMEKLI